MNFMFIIIGALCVVSQPRNNEEMFNILESIDKEYDEKEDTNIFDSYLKMTELEEYQNVCNDYKSEKCAKLWLQKFDEVHKRNSNRMSNLNFRFSTNINKKNENILIKLQNRNIEIRKKMKIKLLKFQWSNFQSKEIKRIFQLITPTIQSKNKTISKVLLNISHKIKNIYNNGLPCFKFCLSKGESGIVELFRKEKDYDKLLGFWSAWRNVTGRKIKKLFLKRMNLQNIGAKENHFSDAASFNLKDSFEENNFNETFLQLYDEILPFYKQLHGYVRYCLSKFYPNRFDINGPIPAHILGNVWAQQWNNILPIMQKCRERLSAYNIQDEANQKLKSISVKRMFEMAEEFYKSIGMYSMTPYFWKRSVITKIPGKLMDCHGSATNFLNCNDYRIKMCTKQDINDFTTIHHEMGHIEYYMAYCKLPYTFQGSANPGFHEAIGDTIALSVKTPEHLKNIGIIQNITNSKEFDIDYLLATALEKVSFLPFALTMDSYLWSVYNGSVPYTKLNEHWWNLRYRFQGLKPPIERFENDFDPGAKYHMAFGRSYIRYFASFLLQFQFYESLCQLSGQSGKLHRCDFYGSKRAGNRLLKMLKMGQSQHWKDTLKILTGTREISSKSLMNYFEPLFIWLKKTNKKLNVPIGW